MTRARYVLAVGLLALTATLRGEDKTLLIELPVGVQVLSMSSVTFAQTSFTQPGGTGDSEGAQPAKKLPAAQRAPPVERPLNPSQELAKEQSEGHALQVGATEMRIGGYVGLTAIHRSTNGDGGTGTGFGSIPYDDTLQGNVSETRFSAQ